MNDDDYNRRYDEGIFLEEEEEEQRQGESTCAAVYLDCCQAAARISDEYKNSVPDLSAMSDKAEEGPETSSEGGRASGIYSGTGDSRVGGTPPSRVSTPRGEDRRHKSSLLRSEGSSWRLPQLSLPESRPAIRDEGEQLHLEHGPDDGIERDMETGEAISKRRKTSGSYRTAGDEGIELFRKAIAKINAEHDAWVQANPWFSQLEYVTNLFQ